MKTLLYTSGLLAIAACTASQPGELDQDLPMTCRDIVDADREATDGEYLLYIEAEPSMPWEAYCHDMAGQPREFLTLHAGEGRNESRLRVYDQGDFSSVITRYEKVRIDPHRLEIDIGDQTFAVSEGGARAGDVDVTSMPFGVASSCTSAGEVPMGAQASIDLVGSPFVIDSNFCLRDAAPAASSIWSTAQSRVELLVSATEPGVCASASVAPCPGGLYNDAGSYQLRLAYQP